MNLAIYYHEFQKYSVELDKGKISCLLNPQNPYPQKVLVIYVASS